MPFLCVSLYVCGTEERNLRMEESIPTPLISMKVRTIFFCKHVWRQDEKEKYSWSLRSSINYNIILHLSVSSRWEWCVYICACMHESHSRFLNTFWSNCLSSFVACCHFFFLYNYIHHFSLKYITYGLSPKSRQKQHVLHVLCIKGCLPS